VKDPSILVKAVGGITGDDEESMKKLQ